MRSEVGKMRYCTERTETKGDTFISLHCADRKNAFTGVATELELKKPNFHQVYAGFYTTQLKRVACNDRQLDPTQDKNQVYIARKHDR